MALSQLAIKISQASFPHVAWLVLSESVDYSKHQYIVHQKLRVKRSYQNTELVEEVSSSIVVSTAELLLPKLIKYIDHLDRDLDTKS